MEGYVIDQLNEEMYNAEVDVISSLYNDQQGRAKSIENHIVNLKEQRRVLGKLESFLNLPEGEQEELTEHYGVTREEFVKRCKEWDDKEAYDAMLPEERRKHNDNKLLDNVNMNQLMSMALTNRKVVEFNQEEDPFAQSKE